tara:strand:+ start:21538 stop:23484 length:1947 start_codon:yes stop_codon:yes gene_type:complete
MNNMINKFSDIKEFILKIGLVFISFMISRWLFLFFNSDIIKVENLSEILFLSYYGLKFDLAAIIYLEAIFIILFFFPGRPNSNYWYNKLLNFFYFFGGLIGLLLNFIDFAYYRFNLIRINAKFFEAIENEKNKVKLISHFIIDYIHIIILFIIFCGLWIYAYRLIKVSSYKRTFSVSSFSKSILTFLIVIILCIGGIRGDFKKSTRPITLIHAMEKVDNPQHADLILNSSFTVIRTIGKTSFKPTNLYTKNQINSIIKPIKKYSKVKNDTLKPNVMIIILESMGREYWGSLNSDDKIPNYKGYTPFLDSLANNSLIFPNFYANSRKSIHGMPAILAGVPSFETAYTSSPYSNQPIESIVSVANSLGYNTSFFHGASNGSMGFLGFSKILGYDNYYGKDEYNNDSDFDGYWGIWDEPFFLFTKEIIDKTEEPFLTTLFTVTSHDPYIIPEEYEDVFEKGFVPMHQTVGYTDFAIKKFFSEAKNEPWFENTVFVFTADHGNQTHYPYYEKIINRFANPLMIYWPNGNLKGISNRLGQHMDIFPTIVDLIGYDKPFRSWGTSLITDDETDSFVVNFFGGGSYFMMNNEYIVVSNGEKTIGFYDANDHDLKVNLIDKTNKKMDDLSLKFNLFLQDYMNRIVQGDMFYKSSDE